MPESRPADPAGGAAHWNPSVRPERRAADHYQPDAGQLEALRGIGFTAVQALPRHGVLRGSGCVALLGDGPAEKNLLAAEALQGIAFETRRADYPRSLMGVIALLRQTFSDAQWYQVALGAAARNKAERPAQNDSLAALSACISGRQTAAFQARDELDFARAARIAEEFGLRLAYLGNGYEYRAVEAIRAAKPAAAVVPLGFPHAPAVESPELADEVSLEALEHWDLAPSNAALLAAAKLPICLTAHGMKKPADEFWKAVRQAVRRGLSADAALRALTSQPAELLGETGRLGTVAPGKLANLAVADGDLFADKEAKLWMTWVEGEPFESERAREIDPRGEWEIRYTGAEGPARLAITGEPGKPKVKAGDAEVPAERRGDQLLLFPAAKLFGIDGDEAGAARLTGYLMAGGGGLAGVGALPGGKEFSWSAKRVGDAKPEEKKAEDDDKTGDAEPRRFAKYPAGAYGRAALPDQPAALLIRGATVWTCGEAGVLESGDVLVKAGKIAEVGIGLAAPEGAAVIDGAGLHVTPGLIDCHSHSAISRGINEGSHAVTVECRIGDVLNPADIALYRELAQG
ncbi:MAG: amidohydrolase family protein [Verrucomicrobiales bacterium]